MGPESRGGRTPWLVGLGLSGLVAAVYGRTCGFGYVNLDDQLYVYENAYVLRGLSWPGLAWAFTTFETSNWHPLTWLSLMVDVDLLGAGAGGHHLVNLLLHLVDTLLLFAWLRGMTGATWRSGLAAALFAVHPLHVESVAWISERKDVLSTLFWLLSSIAWTRYARRPRPGPYAAALALLAVGLLAKPMLVTLPLTLLLLDAWPLGRLRWPDAAEPEEPGGREVAGLLAEIVPFLAIAAVSALATVRAQSGSALVALESIPFRERVANALVSMVRYLADVAWPSPLAALYPHPAVAEGGVPAWRAAGAALLLAAITWLCLRQRRRRPYLAWGWLWYLVTLLPVIGVVQVGVQARADRYTYVPSIGIFVALVWGAAEAVRAWPRARAAASVAGGAMVLALSVLAWRQAGTWRDSQTLWRHAVQVTHRNWQAWTGLGEALADEGRLDEAVAAYQHALRVNPRHAAAWNGLGVASGRLGHLDLAVRRSEEAVRLDPSQPKAWYNLGTTYGRLGRHDRAAESFRQAVRLKPDFAQAWSNLGVASLALGDRASAVASWRRLAALDPAAAQRLRALIDTPAPP